jgi:NMD protein affecting ribosome stability and mRNA decay
MKNDAMIGGPELICADCGVRFHARRVTDGVEEICDDCYEARFPTLSVPPHPTVKLRDHLAAD